MSCGSSVSPFEVSRCLTLTSVFRSSYTILHSHQQCLGAPLSPRPRHHVLVSVFSVTAVLAGVKWELMGVLICASLRADDVEQVLIYLIKRQKSWPELPFLCSPLSPVVDAAAPPFSCCPAAPAHPRARLLSRPALLPPTCWV